MCELFAISSKHPNKVTFTLDEFASHGGIKGPHADGWGMAFFQDTDVQLIREITPAANSKWLRFVRNNQTESQLILSHIRKARIGGVSLKNTQPFVREVFGRQHAFSHNGYLDKMEDINLNGSYLPVGETDSEIAFCYLLNRMHSIWKSGTPTLTQRTAVIGAVFEQLAERGPANFIYIDGEYLFAYGNKRIKPNGRIEPPGLYCLEKQCCPREINANGVDLKGHDADSRQAIVMIASVPLTPDQWIPIACSELVVAQFGQIVRRESLSTHGAICQPID